MHQSVLKNEVVEAFSTLAGGVVADATLGLGGHSEAIVSALPQLRVLGIDRDSDALQLAKERLSKFADLKRVFFKTGEFSQLANIWSEAKALFPGEELLAGILVDLGVSSLQLDSASRGFSFRSEAALDMRMNQADSVSAAEVLNNYTPEDLKRVFRRGGVGRLSAALAAEVIKARPITTTTAFAEICRAVLIRGVARSKLKDKSDLATVPFQAVRIEVNKEIEQLNDLLTEVPTLLAEGGRFVAISFHSLEDKIVTKALRSLEGGELGDPRAPQPPENNKPRYGQLLTKKAITPTQAESESNPRSRSARMRIFERQSNLVT